MNDKVGSWIDHRKAVIISASADRVTVKTLESEVGPHSRYSGRARPASSLAPPTPRWLGRKIYGPFSRSRYGWPSCSIVHTRRLPSLQEWTRGEQVRVVSDGRTDWQG